ncbi:phosphate signaling complex PhoU family protein [Streptomyces sp. NPDC003860]
MRLVGAAMGRATSALAEADLQLAESVIAVGDELDALQRDLEEEAILVLALQQPVAMDLRAFVTSPRMSGDLERCGILAQHVAVRHRNGLAPGTGRRSDEVFRSVGADVDDGGGQLVPQGVVPGLVGANGGWWGDVGVSSLRAGPIPPEAGPGLWALVTSTRPWWPAPY